MLCEKVLFFLRRWCFLFPGLWSRFGARIDIFGRIFAFSVSSVVVGHGASFLGVRTVLGNGLGAAEFAARSAANFGGSQPVAEHIYDCPKYDAPCPTKLEQYRKHEILPNLNI